MRHLRALLAAAFLVAIWQPASAAPLRFVFTFMHLDAVAFGHLVVDSSLMQDIVNHGQLPADGGLVDYSKVLDLHMEYHGGEFGGGGVFGKEDFAYLKWTTPTAFDLTIDPQVEELIGQVVDCNGTPTRWRDCAALSAFTFGAARSDPDLPTEVGPFAIKSDGSGRTPDLMSLYLDPFPQPIPEPSTYALLGAGLALTGLVANRRRRR